MKKQNRCKEFIEKSKEKHNYFYDYSKVVYTNAHTPVTIICPLHGPFQQKPVVHYNHGSGCQKCKGGAGLNTTSFIENAKKIHQDMYDYSKVVYKNNITPVIIICKKHGEFSQIPKLHIRGSGCSTCKGGKPDSPQDFIKKAKHKYGSTYSYESVIYTKSSDPVKITCPTHGIFTKTPNAFLSGQGCPSCSKEKPNKRLLTDDSFFQKVETLQQGQYLGPQTTWNGYSNKLILECDIHGTFEKYPANFLTHRQGCPKCSDPHTSKDEKEISTFLEDLGISIIPNDRTTISPYELDILIPDHRIAIEYCGLRWHSEWFGKKGKYYHLNKLEKCQEKDIRLITIFEDEWINKKTVVKSTLRNALGKGVKGIYARNTIIQKINWNYAKQFLDIYHLQGAGAPTKLRYGAYHNGVLVGVMTFGKGRAALGSINQSHYEIVRFASDGRNHPGLFSKLLKTFTREYQPRHIISYADRRWFDGKSYSEMKFSFRGNTSPSYWYFLPNRYKRVHRYSLRKHKLVEKGGDPALTEWENAIKMGYDRVWDCGNLAFELIT